jgi:hypothetical protein
MRSRIIFKTVLTVILFNVNVLADDYIVDRSWERPASPYNHSSWSIKNNQSLGQEFTAGADTITALALSISYFDSNPCGNTSFTAKIRNSTITGAVVASCTITLDNLFETDSNPSDEWRYFDFKEAIPVIPENRYIIDLSIPIGSAYWSWNGWEDSDNIGLPGRQIVWGNIYDNGEAFGFRTYTVPEPSMILLLGFGASLLRKRRRYN